MKFGYILCGLLILANPNIGIIDILPDFIGYFLIIKGLSVTTVFIPNLNNSEKSLWKMFAISVAKALLSFVLLKNIHTMPLLLSFSFAVIELIFLLPALNNLFEGIFYVVMRFNGNSVLHSKKKSKIVRDPVTGQRGLKEIEVDHGSSVKLISVCFIIYRTVLSVVPTLTDLQLPTQSGEVEAVETVLYSDFNNVISLLTFAICFIGSVVFMSFIIPYFTKLMKDSELQRGIENAFQSELVREPKIPIGLDFKKITVFICGAVITFNSALFDGINYFPKIISAIFLICAAVSLSKYFKKALVIIIPAVLAGIVSIPNLLGQIKYFSVFEYVYEDSLWINTASTLYAPLRAYSLIENLLMLPAMLFLIIALYGCWKRECVSDDMLFTPDRFTLESRESIKKRFGFVIALTVLVSLIWALHPILVLNLRFISTIAVIVSLLWTLFVLYFVLDIYGHYKKYISKE